MLKRTSATVLLCRAASLGGPGSQFSVSRFGHVRDPSKFQQSKSDRDALRLYNQRFIAKDPSMCADAKHAICRKCGVTTVVMGFEQTPSARLGLFGRCVEGIDFCLGSHWNILKEGRHSIH